MLVSREEAERDSPSQNQIPASSAAVCYVPSSSLGTKDVGIMKSQTSHQLFKVTQAPRWT